MDIDDAAVKVIRRRMRRTKTTMRDLARESGIPLRTLAAILGYERGMRLRHTKLLADALDVPAAKIVGDAEDLMEGHS